MFGPWLCRAIHRCRNMSILDGSRLVLIFSNSFRSFEPSGLQYSSSLALNLEGTVSS